MDQSRGAGELQAPDVRGHSAEVGIPVLGSVGGQITWARGGGGVRPKME